MKSKQTHIREFLNIHHPDSSIKDKELHMKIKDYLINNKTSKYKGVNITDLIYGKYELELTPEELIIFSSSVDYNEINHVINELKKNNIHSLVFRISINKEQVIFPKEVYFFKSSISYSSVISFRYFKRDMMNFIKEYKSKKTIL